MGRTAKIAVIAVLGGLLMALAVLHASSPPAPRAAVAQSSGADAQSAARAVSQHCRTATIADPECTAAWEAKRRHFFGQKD